jgi:DNA (cytosine-5)-methyltransferase 1
VKKFKFIDLFAGIGGFHLAFHSLGAECVYASEIDAKARETYELNLKKISPKLFKKDLFNKDILNEDYNSIPNFDILCAGFPCQPFSQAGHKRGFKENYESRGNMFFAIRDIIKEKKPKAIFLENVRHLIKHDNGNTFRVIRKTIEEDLGYSFNYSVIKASDYGLPQHRPRVFIVGFRDEKTELSNFIFPPTIPLKFNMSRVLGGKCDREIGFTLRVGGGRSAINDRRNWDGYLVDGKVVRITKEQGKKMMGYPKNFKLPESNAQAMKQLGNSVAVPAIKYTAKNIIKYLDNPKSFKTINKNLELKFS